MARLKRAELFDPGEVAVMHVMSRVVRRCFLFGNDPVSGRNFDHRKGWIEKELQRSAACFGIDLLAFALMSNHLHLILRSRPDVVATWDDAEVARRWLMLCPKRKHKDASAKEPSQPELDSIRNDAHKVREIRRRLSDISWWMRLICQRIAQRANAEEDQQGKFWQSRYRAVRLLDEEAILACAAYVDLNPVRAAAAETIEQSEFTSVKRRIAALRSEVGESAAQPSMHQPGEAFREKPGISAPDAFLSPVQVDAVVITDKKADNKSDADKKIGHQPPSDLPGTPRSARCSDRGFASMSSADYIQLLDWTARQIAPGKRGFTPADTPPIFERLKLRSETWCELVTNFGAYFSLVAGQPQRVDEYRSRLRRQRFYLKSQTRQLLSA